MERDRGNGTNRGNRALIGKRWGRGDHLFAFEVVVIHFDAEYDPRADCSNCICEP